MRFLLCSLVSSCFLVLLRWFFFLIFSFISVCVMVSAPSILRYSQVLVNFFFSRCSDFFFFFDLVVLFLPSFVVFCFSLLSWLISLCQIPSLYTDCTECSGYDIKQSDGEVLVMLELWGMRSTPSLPLLPGTLWPEMVAHYRALSKCEIELHTYVKLNCLN